MTNQTPSSHTHEPTPEERLANAIEGIRHLPPVGGVTFRGITTPRTTAPSVLVTQNITATSRDLTVATIGLTSPGIAAVILHTGRDVTPLSAVPQAQEVALLPGTVLFTGRFVEIAGHTVENRRNSSFPPMTASGPHPPPRKALPDSPKPSPPRSTTPQDSPAPSTPHIANASPYQ